MKQNLHLLLLFIFTSQVVALCQDSINVKSEYFDYDNSTFFLIQESWKAIQVPTTASIPYVASIQERRVELQQGEGSNSNFSLFEPNTNIMYPLFFGRKDDKGGSFSKMNLFTIDYGFDFRLTLDDSKPLTPPSNRGGFSLIQNIYNNYNKLTYKAFGKKITDIDFQISNKDFFFINLMTQIHHYSNGQSHSSTITVNGETRNNYKNGDFSTNYLFNQLTFGKYKISSMALRQLSLGYRFDFGTKDGVLVYSGPQYYSYGRHRLRILLDNWSPIIRLPIIKSPVAFHLRCEAEVIVDDVSQFRPNNYSEKLYRWNAKGMFEILPEINRSVGFFVSAYIGRDYLNIRYDDIVFVGNAGITLSMDKYRANIKK